MLELLEWDGPITVNDVDYEDINTARKSLENSDLKIDSVILHSTTEKANKRNILRVSDNPNTVYKVSVRKYMTKPASIDFDFMKKWNNDVPMPLMIMFGTIGKETSGMYYMKLHGGVSTNGYCSKCGQLITNPVSKLFGMEPICGNHNYTNPFNTDEELQSAIDEYQRTHLTNVTWEGWVIKSAITSLEEVQSG